MNQQVIEPVQLGNVFLEGERVSVGVKVQGEASWVLRDLEGVAQQGNKPAGEQAIALHLPEGERGHYTLSVHAEGGKQVMTSLAVLEPFDLGRVDSSPFGVCTHFGQLRGENEDLDAPSRVSHEVIPLISRAGFKTQRDELPWNRVEPHKGRCVHPNAHQAYMASCGAHEVKSLIILDYGNRHYDNAAAPHTDEGLRGYANYAREVVRRYGDQIEAVEVWNEYNGSFSKGPAGKRPEGYFEMLKRTYRAVKEERPELPVVGPAGVTLPYGWLERLFSLGALEYLDAVSVHPYIYPAPPDTARGDLSAKLEKLQALIRRHNRGEPKPVQLTEIGWPNPRRGVSAREQAQFGVRGLVMALASGVDKVYWYELVNSGTDSEKRGQNFGLLHSADDPKGAYTPKLAYVALAVLARQLTGAHFKAKDPTSDPVYSYLFERGGEEVRVMWAARRAQRPAGALETTVRAEGPLSVTNMVGKTRVLEPQGSEVRLALSEDPIYLRGAVRELASDSKGLLGTLRRIFG